VVAEGDRARGGHPQGLTVPRMFGDRNACSLEVVGGAFRPFQDGHGAAAPTPGLEALAMMGSRQYYELLADRTTPLAAAARLRPCGDSEVGDLVRARSPACGTRSQARQAVDPVTVEEVLRLRHAASTPRPPSMGRAGRPWRQRVAPDHGACSSTYLRAPNSDRGHHGGWRVGSVKAR